MKTIVNGKEKICRLLGLQKVIDAAYRPLKYLIYAECRDGLLLHNVITGQLILLNNEESRMFFSIPAMPVKLLLPLIENFFLVPEDYNEKETVVELRRLLK